MAALKIFFIIIYGISFILLWFENRFIVCDNIHRPLWFHRGNQPIFLLVRLIITFGSILGLFISYGLIVALISLVFHWVVAKITLRVYFNKEVKRQIALFSQTIRETKIKSGEPIDEDEIFQKSREWAVDTVVVNMKTGGMPTDQDWVNYHLKKFG